MNSESPVHALIGRIRDYVNEPRKQHQLLQDRSQWNQLCTAMDVIEDTELAVSAYVDDSLGTDHGARYLATYGLLQAIFQQQDAINHLAEALGIPDQSQKHPALKIIRELRNDSVGHPTKRAGGKGRGPSFHAISRISLNHARFQMLSYDGNRHWMRDVNLPDVIAIQRRCATGILTFVADSLQEEQTVHKDAFKSEKLAAIFPSTLSYYFEKIYAGANNPSEESLASGCLDIVSKVLDDTREALARRDISAQSHDAIGLVYERIEHALSRLHEYFENAKVGLSGAVDATDAYIYTSFLQDQVEELRSMVTEIDEDYASQP